MLKVSGRTITLRDFSLMKDGSELYYCENFGVEDYGFGRVLVPKHYGYKFVDKDTAEFSSLKVVTGLDSIFEDDTRFYYFIDTSTQLFIKKALTSGGKELKDANDDCLYPDLKITGTDTNDKILFSTKSKIGVIHRGEATGGSSTTLIDTTVDFTAGEFASENNHGALVAGDVVYNIKDGKLFTIDAGGIAATTLTITAVDGGDFANGDNYAIVNSDWCSLTDSVSTYGRQIIEFDEDFYILNGDALAIVDNAGAYEAEHKLIESGWIARTGASNGDSIAIGCNKNNLGKIFIWDKHSNGWNKKISLDNEIKSIVAYKNGYIFICGNSVWWTDTYTTRRLSEIPDAKKNVDFDAYPRSLVVVENVLLLNGGIANSFNRIKHGIRIYDISKDEWTYCPYDPKGSLGDPKTAHSSIDISGCVFYDSERNRFYYSFKNTGYGYTNEYILSRFMYDYKQNQGCIITNPIRLGKDARIKKIEVNLVQNLSDYENVPNKSVKISCKLSNCKKPLWRHISARADSIAKDVIKVDGSSSYVADAQVGDEIMAMNGWNGFLRRRITAIANNGTNTEEWTLDSELPELTKSSTIILVTPFQLYGMNEKTISEETEMLEFYPNFFGDSVMIEIYIIGTTNSPQIAIQSVKLYYE